MPLRLSRRLRFLSLLSVVRPRLLSLLELDEDLELRRGLRLREGERRRDERLGLRERSRERDLLREDLKLSRNYVTFWIGTRGRSDRLCRSGGSGLQFSLFLVLNTYLLGGR